tara:strand:+ start:2690 stop:3010 length:321 start_codon:yes stop_codon:yes gene_type:complete
MKKNHSTSKSANQVALERLLNAGKKAFDLLLEEVEKPIDSELRDDQARNAMKSKKECFMDAKDIQAEVQRLEASLSGEEIPEDSVDEENTFKGGFAEKFAKMKNQK